MNSDKVMFIVMWQIIHPSKMKHIPSEMKQFSLSFEGLPPLSKMKQFSLSFEGLFPLSYTNMNQIYSKNETILPLFRRFVPSLAEGPKGGLKGRRLELLV